jgi:hypothetical protein
MESITAARHFVMQHSAVMMSDNSLVAAALQYVCKSGA